MKNILMRILSFLIRKIDRNAYIISREPKNHIYIGNEEPKNPKEGDYWYNPSGHIDLND